MIEFGQDFKTTRYDIFNYWKNKKITHEGVIVNISDKTDGHCTIPVIDWGEPECFHCGKPILVEKEKSYDKWLKNGDFESIWNSLTMKKETKILGLAPKKFDAPNSLTIVCYECYNKLIHDIKREINEI